MKIHTLDLQFQGLEQAIAVFVVETSAGLALVECGPASTLPHLKAALQEKGWQMADFQHVFLSHIHFDHAGAAWAFAENGANIFVHPKGLPHLAAPEKLYLSASMIYGDAMEQLWGEMRPIATDRLYAPEDGESIRLGQLSFRALYTPGHAIHHIAWQVFEPGDEANGVIFTGDVAGVKIGEGPVMPPCPPPDIHVEDWQASLKTLRDCPSKRLILTHYGEIAQPDAHLDDLEKRLLDWAAWMKPYFDKQTPAAEIVPLFQNYVQTELIAAGVAQSDLVRYEAANPAFMSVAGLLRYWKKRVGY